MFDDQNQSAGGQTNNQAVPTGTGQSRPLSPSNPFVNPTNPAPVDLNPPPTPVISQVNEPPASQQPPTNNQSDFAIATGLPEINNQSILEQKAVIPPIFTQSVQPIQNQPIPQTQPIQIVQNQPIQPALQTQPVQQPQPAFSQTQPEPINPTKRQDIISDPFEFSGVDLTQPASGSIADLSRSYTPPPFLNQPPLQSFSSPISQAPSFSTPELAKRQIIEKADEGDKSIGESVYTMDSKFRHGKPKKIGGPKKKNIFLIIIILILLVAAGGAGFYFWAQKYFQPGVPTPITVPETSDADKKTGIGTEIGIGTESIETPEPILSLEQTLEGEFKNEKDEVVSTTEFYLPAGAIDSDLKAEISIESITAEQETGDYKIIGGLNKISFYKETTNDLGEIIKEKQSDISFSKPTILKIFYEQKLVEDDWEKDLVLGYFKDNLWTPLNSILDFEKNVLTISLEFLPTDSFGIIVEKTKIVLTIEEFQVGPNLKSSVDSDSDGLTDVEEEILKTEKNNPDTDADGMPDGQEISNLTDPVQSGDTKLAVSGLVNVYTNRTYAYSFFYPAPWLVRSLPETDNQEVLVITNTGEFFSITVINNPSKLSPFDWYTSQSSKVDPATLYKTVINNYEAVWSPDHLTIYIGKDDRIYVIFYIVGVEQEANFKNIFSSLINSFQFVSQPQGRADMTLIKYADKPEIYLIEDGEKRAFASGEIFEKLGFKWEDIIEIPYGETYVDGEIISGRLNGALIKYVDSSGVYLVENGKKRAFASGEVFEALGYKWEDVIEIQSNEIYPDGATIESAVSVKTEIQETNQPQPEENQPAPSPTE